MPPPRAPRRGAAALLREIKERHYASWVDEPLPALGGQTPRAALRTREGRARVDVLLKDLENLEARLPQDERFDVAVLRARLGLEA